MRVWPLAARLTRRRAVSHNTTLWDTSPSTVEEPLHQDRLTQLYVHASSSNIVQRGQPFRYPRARNAISRTDRPRGGNTAVAFHRTGTNKKKQGRLSQPVPARLATAFAPSLPSACSPACLV